MNKTSLGFCEVFKSATMSDFMYKLLKKIRRQPESVKKTVAASIIAVLMVAIGWMWVLTMKNNFNNTESADADKESAVVSPLEALKENFAALKNLPLETNLPEKIDLNAEAKKNNETSPENKNFEFFEKIKDSLNKSWHWAYDPLKK